MFQYLGLAISFVAGYVFAKRSPAPKLGRYTASDGTKWVIIPAGMEWISPRIADYWKASESSDASGEGWHTRGSCGWLWMAVREDEKFYEAGTDDHGYCDKETLLQGLEGAIASNKLTAAPGT